MGKVILSRPEVAEKYTLDIDKDIIVHAKGYSGKISKINLEGAAHMAKDKNLTYFTAKNPAPAAAVKDEKVKT